MERHYRDNRNTKDLGDVIEEIVEEYPTLIPSLFWALVIGYVMGGRSGIIAGILSVINYFALLYLYETNRHHGNPLFYWKFKWKITPNTDNMSLEEAVHLLVDDYPTLIPSLIGALVIGFIVGGWNGILSGICSVLFCVTLLYAYEGDVTQGNPLFYWKFKWKKPLFS